MFLSKMLYFATFTIKLSSKKISLSVKEVATVLLTIRFLNIYLLLSLYFLYYFLQISFDDFQMLFVAKI